MDLTEIMTSHLQAGCGCCAFPSLPPASRSVRLLGASDHVTPRPLAGVPSVKAEDSEMTDEFSV